MVIFPGFSNQTTTSFHDSPHLLHKWYIVSHWQEEPKNKTTVKTVLKCRVDLH